MVDYGKDFQQLLQEQKQYIEHYEETLKSYLQDKEQQENQLLKKNLAELEQKQEALKGEYDALQKEAQALNWALREQVASEKLGFIIKTSERMNTYFKQSEREVQNKLVEVENKLQLRLSELRELLGRGLEQDTKQFEIQAQTLEAQIKARLKWRQSQFKEQEKQLEAGWTEQLEKLKQEPLDEETLKKRLKQNNIEAKIGLHWINKIGIILILIGIITAMKYSYSNLFTDEIKGIFGFVIGLCFLGAGEFFQQKKKEIFAQGLIGGGIGALYLTLFSSYFILDIIGMKTAIFLSVLISMTTFVLSLRYKSKSIAALGLIGGYLPFLSYAFLEQGLEGSMVYIGMLYILLLNGVTLILSRYKDWSLLYYLSFFTNLPITLYLSNTAPDIGIGILYTVIAFGIYLVMLLGYSLRQQEPLKIGKIVVLGINTFISCEEIYRLFMAAGWKEFRGLLAVFFCLTYILLAHMVEKRVPKERQAPVIFRLTSLTFAILVVPFQFGVVYVTLGWLIEALLLIGYGLKAKVKAAERGGVVLFVLCVLSFYWNAIGGKVWEGMTWELNYGLIIGGMCFVLTLYLLKAQREVTNGQGQPIVIGYKYFTLFNVWIYLIHLATKVMKWLNTGDIAVICVPLVDLLLIVGVTALLAYGMKNISLLYDKAMPYVSGSIYFLLDLVGIWLSMTNLGLITRDEPVGIVLIGLYNFLIFIHLRSVLKAFISSRRQGVEYYPIILFLYSITMITAILTNQLEVPFFEVGLSLFYIVAAFLLIAFGFKWRYRLSRYWGLGLTILAVAKLFLLDLSQVTAIHYRLLSYFAFGVILLGISYLYQLFSKKLGLEEIAFTKGKGEEQ